jgi:DNA-binding LacI/PurR family transcriptional regulator
MHIKQSNEIRLSDIARSCGVSLATVSLVLNNKPGVSDVTRTMVLDIANSLGYKPKQAKTNKEHHPLQSIGLIIRAEPNDADKGKSNVFYSHVIAGIENACRENHISLLLTSMLVDENNYPVEIPRLLLEDRIDGYLLLGIHLNSFLNNALQDARAPAILVDAYSNFHPYDSVLTANNEGVYKSVEHLLSNGHRKVGFIGGWKGSFPSFEERRMGYCACLADHGITDRFFADTTSRREDILQAVHKLLSDHPEITALVGVNDDTAIGAMNVLLDLGLRVPEDISVIGFDDILAAGTMNPPLTTMQIDKTSMGHLAVELLAFRKQKPDANPVMVSLRPILIERNSVKNVMQKKVGEMARA